MPRPVLLFAFANDRTDDESFLRNLTEEQKAIEAVLRPRQLRDWDVKFVPGVTVAEVFDVFQQPEIEGCITLLHFAGHADGEALVMERDGRQIEPAGKDGLAEFLGAQEGLRVVFLNACSTRKVAEAMIKQGVPAVIATSRAIDDEVACQFAVRFYTGLAGGRTVEESFNAAANEVRTWLGAAYEEVFRKDDDGMRFPGCETEIRILAQNHEWPWRLLTTEGTSGLHARQWSLALHDPLLGVPSLPPGLSAPSSDRSPFRVLAWFEASDARIFFGRGRDIRELWQAIENPSQGIVLLHGP
ncbi:MAG: CHAT domain-containing protein, partial [Verrucomicrobia bacterium]|nr:CHAT domain-containing protein [Verrucomicrobiota bacterium]